MISSDNKLPEMVYLNYIYSGFLDISYDSCILFEPPDHTMSTIVLIGHFSSQ